jgi:hypothetical protein
MENQPMKRQVFAGRSGFVAVLAIGLIGVGVAGCEDKLTRARFDMITINVDGKYDVEKMIGPPDDKLFDMWSYERVDEHLNVFIHFNEADVVSRKEWHDTLNDVHFDTMPPGEEPAYESTVIRRIDD